MPNLKSLIKNIGNRVADRQSPHRAPDADIEDARNEMVAQLRRYGIRNPRIIEAIRRVRRHEFIPERFRRGAADYGNYPHEIGFGQTISQPYIVAYMTELLDPQPHEKILEIGTGSGYQSAVLAALGADVFTIDIVPELGRHGEAALRREGWISVRVRIGDGHGGWPAAAPFDGIIITCAPPYIPELIVGQLRVGGRMVLPVGRFSQHLTMLRKNADSVTQSVDLPVRFVPMVKQEIL